LIGLTLSHFSLGFPAAIELLEPLWWLTATTTIWSWIGYLDGSGVDYLEIKEKAKQKAMDIKEFMERKRLNK
jgi:hypothetical protein